MIGCPVQPLAPTSLPSHTHTSRKRMLLLEKEERTVKVELKVD